MVRAGSVLTFDVRGTVSAWLPMTPSGLRGQVLNALSPSFQVFDLGLWSESATGLGFPTIVGSSFPYTATLTLQTREDFGRAEDIAAIVAHVFYAEGGAVPTVTVRGGAVAQTTGGPSAAGALSSLFSSVSGMIGLVVIGLVAVAVIRVQR